MTHLGAFAFALTVNVTVGDGACKSDWAGGAVQIATWADLAARARVARSRVWATLFSSTAGHCCRGHTAAGVTHYRPPSTGTNKTLRPRRAAGVRSCLLLRGSGLAYCLSIDLLRCGKKQDLTLMRLTLMRTLSSSKTRPTNGALIPSIPGHPVRRPTTATGPPPGRLNPFNTRASSQTVKAVREAPHLGLNPFNTRASSQTGGSAGRVVLTRLNPFNTRASSQTIRPADLQLRPRS